VADTSKIRIELEGLGRILGRNLCVPIYQRSYAWQAEHVSDLLNDISTAMTGGAAEYFIGSIVTRDSSDDRVEVADGQQRLATATILIAAIRDYLQELGDQDRAAQVSSERLYQKDLLTQELTPRLTLNDGDNDFFIKRVLHPPGDPLRAVGQSSAAHARIEKAAQLAKEYVARQAASGDPLPSLVALLNYVMDSVKAIWVQVPDDTNAFMVFETLNDRGLALAITDLLKNHLFNTAGRRLDEARRAWTAMVSSLESVGDEEVVLTFLRHYWSSRNGLVREKDLYPQIKKQTSNEARAISFAKELERGASAYCAICNPEGDYWTSYGEAARAHANSQQPAHGADQATGPCCSVSLWPSRGEEGHEVYGFMVCSIPGPRRPRWWCYRD